VLTCCCSVFFAAGEADAPGMAALSEAGAGGAGDASAAAACDCARAGDATNSAANANAATAPIATVRIDIIAMVSIAKIRAIVSLPRTAVLHKRRPQPLDGTAAGCGRFNLRPA
jgi:hypothetical protein